MRDKFDVIVVGGAAVGSATAYFLRLADPTLRVAVLERDPTYTACATTRSAASVRHQFSTPENVRMSMFGTEFLRHADEALAVPGQPAPGVRLTEGGYLYLATATGWPALQANHAVQQAEGAQVALLAVADLMRRYAWLHTEDLAGGALGLSGEGWFDAHLLLHALRRKAVALGAEYRAAEAVSLQREGARIVGVRLADGTELACGTVVNAAGAGAAALARSAGIALPVEPRKRCVFHFSSPERASGCPLVICPSGLWFRPEGAGFIAGLAPPEADDPESFDFDVPPMWWEEQVWPLLAARVPGFEAARLLSSWAGHYDVNTLDHNVILGAHPAVDNLLFANGFSGHGLQQAPAAGRALAELITCRSFQTLDLSAFGWQRVLEGRPLREANVV